jgi:SAM-dependent methyltransferase
MSLNPTTRFSNRAENYLKYRPHYPAEIIDYLKKENVLNSNSVIADIGSGTGFSSELFLKNGNTVYGIEPNKEMREAGEIYLSGYKKFVSVNGTAENTTLIENSIDIITAGQAFHWFNFDKAKREFNRIIKSNGYIVLFWNIRQWNDSNLSIDYEKLLNEFATDYKEVGHQNISKKNYDVFFKGRYSVNYFDNIQLLDYDGLKGRLLSSSYVPDENHPNYKPMINRLKEIFDKYHKEGKVEIKYIAEVYCGKI